MNPHSSVLPSEDVPTSATSVVTDEAMQDYLKSFIEIFDGIKFSKIIYTLDYLLKSPNEQRSLALPETSQILKQIVDVPETYTLIEALENALTSEMFTELVENFQLLCYAFAESEVLSILAKKIMEIRNEAGDHSRELDIFKKLIKNRINCEAQKIVDMYDRFVVNPSLIRTLEELRGLFAELDSSDPASSELVYQSAPLAKIRKLVNSNSSKPDNYDEIFSMLNTPEIRGKILLDDQLLLACCESYRISVQARQDPTILTAYEAIKQAQTSHPVLIVKQVLREILEGDNKIKKLDESHIFTQQIRQRYEEQTGLPFAPSSSSARNTTNLVHDIASQDAQTDQTPLADSNNGPSTNELPGSHITRNA